MFDDAFGPLTLPGAFVDRGLPAGYAPFNIQELGGRLYVAYAKQDATPRTRSPAPASASWTSTARTATCSSGSSRRVT